MRKVIRLGDSTSHGGTVVTAAPHDTAFGLGVARKGDRCTCPHKGHEPCAIVEGDETDLIDGVPVALEGHRTSCGAVLISTLAEVGNG